MIEQIRGLSFVAYTYEGEEPLRFTVTFPYLKREHVRVLVGDPESPRVVIGKWIDDHTIEIPSQSEFLEAPYTVQLRRFTPIADPAIDFRDGAKLPAKQLNAAVRQLLYAQQELREFGLDGNGVPGSGIPGGSPGDFPDIQTIIDQVLASPAYQTLQERIRFADVNAETLIQDILRSDNYFNVLRDQDGRLVNQAQHISEVETRVTETESTVEVIEGTLATHGEQIATTVSHLTTTASAAQASVTWIEQFAAAFGVGPDGAITGAALLNELSLRATLTQAQAIATSTLSAFAGGTFAALEESFETYVSTNDNRWSSTWSIKVEGGDPANPIIGGIALSANPNGSDFVVQANRFAIVTPSGPGGTYANRKFPFVVGTVGGLSTVGITGQLLVDGSVTADKVTVNSLSAITANAGTINGGTFKTHTLDAAGNVVNALEFRAEMTNVGNWPLWVGSGVKNENNAIFWVDRNGNAGFGGRVSAINIRGEFQKATAIAWTGGTTISEPTQYHGNVAKADFTTIHNFTLAAPELVGDIHTPFVSMSLATNQPVPGLEVIVEELRSSVWVEIGRFEAPETYSTAYVYGGSNSIEGFTLLKSHAFTNNAHVACVGQATATARSFRIRARYERIFAPPGVPTGAGEPIGTPSVANVVSVSGCVFGVR